MKQFLSLIVVLCMTIFVQADQPTKAQLLAHWASYKTSMSNLYHGASAYPTYTKCGEELEDAQEVYNAQSNPNPAIGADLATWSYFLDGFEIEVCEFEATKAAWAITVDNIVTYINENYNENSQASYADYLASQQISAEATAWFTMFDAYMAIQFDDQLIDTSTLEAAVASLGLTW